MKSRIKYEKFGKILKTKTFRINKDTTIYAVINPDWIVEIKISKGDKLFYNIACSNLRNAKYCVRKLLLKLGVRLSREIRIRENSKNNAKTIEV